MAKFEEISTLLQRGKAKDLAALVSEELAAGVAPKDILTEGLIAGMGIVGTKFKNNEILRSRSSYCGARDERGACGSQTRTGRFGR